MKKPSYLDAFRIHAIEKHMARCPDNFCVATYMEAAGVQELAATSHVSFHDDADGPDVQDQRGQLSEHQ